MHARGRICTVDICENNLLGPSVGLSCEKVAQIVRIRTPSDAVL